MFQQENVQGTSVFDAGTLHEGPETQLQHSTLYNTLSWY